MEGQHMTDNRYRELADQWGRAVCLDCSTRSTLVVVELADRAEHDARHGGDR